MPKWDADGAQLQDHQELVLALTLMLPKQLDALPLSLVPLTAKMQQALATTVTS